MSKLVVVVKNALVNNDIMAEWEILAPPATWVAFWTDYQKASIKDKAIMRLSYEFSAIIDTITEGMQVEGDTCHLKPAYLTLALTGKCKKKVGTKENNAS